MAPTHWRAWECPIITRLNTRHRAPSHWFKLLRDLIHTAGPQLPCLQLLRDLILTPGPPSGFSQLLLITRFISHHSAAHFFLLDESTHYLSTWRIDVLDQLTYLTNWRLTNWRFTNRLFTNRRSVAEDTTLIRQASIRQASIGQASVGQARQFVKYVSSSRAVDVAGKLPTTL